MLNICNNCFSIQLSIGEGIGNLPIAQAIFRIRVYFQQLRTNCIGDKGRCLIVILLLKYTV